MGMYTELNLAVQFKQDSPKSFISSISYMAQDSEGVERMIDFPTEHALFGTGSWDWMLRGGSYYFDAKPNLIWKFDEITNTWFLTFVANIKNYSKEWQRFLEYIEPHIGTKGYIGTYRYEEDEDPTLLYNIDGKIVWQNISERINRHV